MRHLVSNPVLAVSLALLASDRARYDVVMTHTYEELHGMTVVQLRDVAKEIEHEAISGYSTMHKEDLLTALCTALGVDAHVHHEVVGIDKAAIKGQIKALKQDRDKALESGNRQELKRVRRQIHRLKRSLRRATV